MAERTSQDSPHDIRGTFYHHSQLHGYAPFASVGNILHQTTIPSYRDQHAWLGRIRGDMLLAHEYPHSPNLLECKMILK